MPTNPSDHLIVAIDIDDLDHAFNIAKAVDAYCFGIKLGPIFFTKYGPIGVNYISRSILGEVMLDLKFHEIPSTVAKAVAVAANEMHPWAITLHAAGGTQMLMAAQSAIADVANKPLLFAVAKLTSSASSIGVSERESSIYNSRIDGVICPGPSINLYRHLLGPSRKIAVPGIRLSNLHSSQEDHIHPFMPSAAIAAGANYIIVGRPITTAADPAKACQDLLATIQAPSP